MYVILFFFNHMHKGELIPCYDLMSVMMVRFKVLGFITYIDFDGVQENISIFFFLINPRYLLFVPF